jgi:hypothetical protein
MGLNVQEESFEYLIMIINVLENGYECLIKWLWITK